MNNLIKLSIFESENLLTQLIFIYDVKQYENKEDFQNLLNESILNHKYKCRFTLDSPFNENCLICIERERTFDKFVHNYISQIKKIIKENKNYFTPEQKEIFCFMKFIIADQVEKEFNFKLIFKMKKFIQKNKNLNSSIFWNTSLFFNYLNKNQVDFNTITNYKFYKVQDETIILIEKSLTQSLEFFMDYENVNGKEIYNIAKEINFNKNKILENILILNNLKYSKSDSHKVPGYCLIIIRFIYEVLFNSKLNETSSILSNFGEYEEFLGFNYNSDKVIQINYNLSKNNLIIKNIGKELIEYKYRNLEDIFHDEIRKEAKRKFLNLINENKMNVISFECVTIVKGIKQKNLERNILHFKLEFKIFPSLNFDDIYMSGTYQILRGDILLIERHVNETGHETSTIVDYSFYLSKIFYMSPILARNILKEIDFNFLFKLKKMTLIQQNKKRKSLENIFEFEYLNYYNFVINHLVLSDEIEDEMRISINQIKKKSEDRIYLNYKIQKLFSIESGSRTYEVLSIKYLRNVVLIGDLGEEEITEEDDPNEDINDFELPDFNSGSSVNTKSSQGVEFISLRDRKNDKGRNTNSSQLRKLTLASMMFSLLLIVFCIVFMIVGIMNSHNMLDTFEILMSFTNLQIYFYHTSTNLLEGFRIPQKNLEEISINNNINNFVIGKYIDNELNLKISILQDKITEFQNLVMDSNYKIKIDTLLSQKMKILRISIIGDTIKIATDEYFITDAIKLLINKIKIILENSNNKNNLKIFTFKNNFEDFTNINTSTLTKRELNIYEILINYPNFYKEFKNFKTQLKQLNLDNLNSIFQLNFILAFTLIGLHFFLILICYYTTKYFNIIINFNVTTINELITPQSVNLFRNKLEILLILNFMYKSDPIKLFSKLKKTNKVEKSKTRRKMDEKCEINKEKLEIDDVYSKYKINKSKLLSPFLKLITTIFSIYFVYTLFYYYFIQASGKKLTFNNEAFDQIAENDNQVFNSLNLLQVMILTNTTDLDLYQRIYEDENTEGKFLFQSVSDILRQRATISKWEKEEPQFADMKIIESKLMNCDYIFTNPDDDIFSSLLKKEYYSTQQENFTLSLQNLCESFNLLESKEFNFLIEEFVYEVKSLLYKYEMKYNSNSAENIINFYNDKSFYKISLISILIIRPIQYSITFSSIYQIVINSLQSYSNLIIIYLVLNICVDFIIFLIILKKIIGEILKINGELNNFIDVIRI